MNGLEDKKVMKGIMETLNSDEPLEPILPVRVENSRHLDSIALAVHLMSGEHLVNMCNEIAGRDGPFFATRMFEWAVKRIAK